MTVLGIDPGFSTLGYALIDGQFPKVLFSGRFEFGERERALEKLPVVLRAIVSLIEDEAMPLLPRVAIEQAWQGSRSHQVAGKLGELVGLLKAAAYERRCPSVMAIPPRTWHAANGLPIKGSRDLIADRAPAMASIRAGYKVTSIDESAAILIAWTAHGLARMEQAA